MTRLEALTALKEAVDAGRWNINASKAARTLWSDNFTDDTAWSAYRGSLDAARALHEALLPRHYAQVHMWPMPEMSRVDIGGGHTGRADCPARAWLLAILSALIAQEQDQ